MTLSAFLGFFLVIQDPLEKELPRIAPTEAKEALGRFTLAAGYRIELVASEPHVSSPVDMAFDESGRLFVVEMIDYPFGDREHSPPEGRLRLLEDSDGRGTFEKSRVLADHLRWPTGLALWDGGAFVLAATDLYYIKDDRRETVLTGFRDQNVQGLANNLKWGLDHWIHASGGTNGGQIFSKRRLDLPAVSINGRDFRFRPTGEVEPLSGGGQFGMSFDDFGRRFVCSNSVNARHVVLEDQFLRRNPYLPVPGTTQSIALDGDAGAVYRTSPEEPWRVVRTRMRVSGQVKGLIEGGGRASGYFTSATGITYYDGRLYVGEVAGNLVHRKTLAPAGVTFRANRMDKESEFLASSDLWFRPVNFAQGPDGALYVIDMYRECIEHPESIPEAIKKHLDLTSGKERGRIWRVRRDGAPAYAKPALGKASAEELARALSRPEPWWRETAARLLFQSQDKSAIPALEKLLLSESPAVRVAALWSLEGLGERRGEALLKDPSPDVREHAVRLSRPESLFLYDDPAPRVRLELAYKMGETQDPRALPVLSRLARGAEPWLRLAIAASSSGRALPLLRLTDSEDLKALLAYTIAARGNAEEVAQAREGATPAVLRGLEAGRGPKARAQAKALEADPDRKKVVASYGGTLQKRGDATRGKALYEKNCMGCHRAAGMGHEVGPDLVTVKAKTPEELIVAILDPSREVNPKYVNYKVLTTAGQVLDGLIESESATSITLKRAQGESDTILRVKIEKMMATGLSLMPDGLEKALDLQGMADVIEFIRSQ
jgi:putative membrane-bound dehydrogenase-like protein